MIQPLKKLTFSPFSRHKPLSPIYLCAEFYCQTSQTDLTMNKILPLLLVLICATAGFAQRSKPLPAPKNSPSVPASPLLSWPGKNTVPPATNPFNLSTPFKKPLPALVAPAQSPASVRVTLGENGMPIMLEGKTTASGNASESMPVAMRALPYIASLEPMGVVAPTEEFVVKTVQTDEQGNNHIRLEQVFQGLPVWGGEVIAHAYNGSFERVNGRYFPTPKLESLTPTLDGEQAITVVKNIIGMEKVKVNWTAEDLRFIDGQPFSAELLIFHPNDATSGERLTWHVVAHPNILSRLVYFVDATTGEVLNSYDNTCNLVGHRHETCENAMETLEPEVLAATSEMLVDGPVTIQGQDLFNVNQSFTMGGWQAGSVYYMENTTKSMYNSAASSMPADPVGVVVTLDGLSTSPQTNGFDYDFVKSNNSTFTNKKAAISAHYNAGLSFDYFKSKFSRNSIDGVGGNILSFVNITEDNGSSMENAFWNGEAMWYGNGGSTFKPLARGLDVGGHEMTHGVVEKTANLVYQGESGALNESFADVFGAMIDSDDWKIGEDVMQTGVNPNNCLRDLSNPHNGVNSNSPWWQPNHTNEQYTGSQDNGGVHINSGITNYAYYLFANNASVGKAKAEQVYYKALRDYLTKNSKFVDCRIAVIQAATDLYGTTVANIAANAFATVGIGGTTPSGNYLGQLAPNPGSDFVLCVSNDLSKLDLATGTGTVLGTLNSAGIQSRPSITDNGLDVIFVNDANDIIAISFDYSSNPIQYTTTALSNTGEWRQAAISKDGRFVAALTTSKDSLIYIFDLILDEQQAFVLYNPTYTEGQVTGDVEFADVLEFDYSGTNIMYDAYNALSNSQGEDLGYWDIGFMEFWDNGQFAPANNAFISKLFSGIPEKSSVANPALAKNSPFVIAFDFFDESTPTTRYDIYGANVETGDYNILSSNNGALGWPNFNRLDTKIIYETNPANSIYNLRLQGLAASKIAPSGNSTAFISNHSWGVWYGNGTRSLQVDAKEPAALPIQVQVSPNPVQGQTQINLTTLENNDALISVCNLLGQTLMTRSCNLAAGANLLDFDMSALPSGTYVIKINAGASSAAVKVVKQ
jgi:Zn-dependent metalloprotease